MTKSDQLFELIHSLKKEEKRHFKLYSKKYAKASDYLKLFDAIAKMKCYDEPLLRAQLAGIHSLARLSVAKDYLYSLILRSLRDMEPVTPEVTVLKLIEDISILQQRRLYVAAKKRFRKAMELARAHDMTGALFMLTVLEALFPNHDRVELIEHERSLLEETYQLFELGVFAESLRAFREEKGTRRTAEDVAEVSEILSKCSYDNPNQLLTFVAKFSFHSGWRNYHEIVLNIDAAVQSLHAIITLYEQHPQYMRTRQLGYVTTVMSLCMYKLQVGDVSTIPEYLDKIKTFEPNDRVKPYCELLLYRFEIQEAIAHNDWERIGDLYEALSSLLARNAVEANSLGKDIRIDYHLLFAKAFFLQGRFEETLSEITHTLQLPTLFGSSQENHVRVLLIVTHYELGNRAYLPYLIRSTYRALLRRKRLFGFEACVLNYIGSLAKLKKQEEIVLSFAQLLIDVRSLAANPIEWEFPWREFYIDWLEKKISART